MSTTRVSSAVHELRVRRPVEQIEAILARGLTPPRTGLLTVSGPAQSVPVVGALHGRRFSGTWSIDGRHGPATVTVVEASRPHEGSGASLMTLSLQGRSTQRALLSDGVIEAAEGLRACVEEGILPATKADAVAERQPALRVAPVLAT